MKNIKQYYKHLGRVAYIIAAADGVVQYEEKSKLKEVVLKELAANENSFDSSGMNHAFYVDFEFDDSIENPTLLKQELSDFNNFIEHHCEPGDEALLQRSVAALETVANAYTKKKEFDIIEVVKYKIQEINSTINKFK